MSLAQLPAEMTPAEAKATGELAVYTEQEIADMGPMANYLDPRRFAQMYRAANLFSQTQLVPKHFQGKPADCFLGLQFAARIKQDPLMVLQQLYIVHGKMGMQAQLAIALMNSCGVFEGPVRWRWDDGKGDERKCYAYAKVKATGEEVSAWVNITMAKAEGWYGKDGSKWKTMPEQMHQYRSATFLGRTQCPEALMGMRTVDEIVDLGEAEVIPPRVSAAELDAAISTEAPAKEGVVVKQAEPPKRAPRKPIPGPLAETVPSEPKRDPGPVLVAPSEAEIDAAYHGEFTDDQRNVYDLEMNKQRGEGLDPYDASVKAYLTARDAK